MSFDKCECSYPYLRGTWTAEYQPQEFFYDAHCCKSAPVCCCGHSPCCGENPCCGNNGLCCGESPCCGENKPCCCEKHEDHEHDKHKECCCVTTSSSTGGAGPLGIITALTAPINVVSTAVNTCCIGKTDNLIQFTALINAPLALVTTLVFQVFRTSCVGTPVPVGSSYTYAATVAALSSQSFAFSFQDEDVAPGTYTYSVQLTTGTTTTVAGLSIANATLSVTAVADD